MPRKSKKSAVERRDVVLAMLRKEEPVPVLARRAGVSENTLYRWREQFLECGLAGLKEPGGKGDARDRRIKDLEKQVAERERVIGELTIANRILKKTSDGLL
jgi:transposase-like protein